MTPIRETIARAAMEARAHEDAPNVGDLLIGSEFIQSCFEDPDDPSDAPFFRSAYGLVIAKAVLRALDEAGCVVVRRDEFFASRGREPCAMELEWARQRAQDLDLP